MLKVKKCNSKLIENIKQLRKGIYEQLYENDILVKENRELKERIKLFDEVKKKNEDLEEQLKLLKKENENLMSKSSVCDAACNTSDLCSFDMDDVAKICSSEDG